MKIKNPIIDGIKFGSQLEGDIYKLLKSGKIGDSYKELKGFKLKSLHPKFIVFNGFKVGEFKFNPLTYTSDFVICKGKEEVVLEVKSAWSAKKSDYRMRIKLFLYKFGQDTKFSELIIYNKNKYIFNRYY